MADGDNNVADPNTEQGRRRLHLRSVIEGESGANDFETPAYDGVGIELKMARERIGAPRPEFASRLRIREPYVRAIEEGRFGDLPGPVYAIGFIRSYADSVGLDGEDFVNRFKRETAARPDQAQLRFPAPEAESRLPSARLLTVSVFLVGAVYGGWYYISNTDRSSVEQVPAVPKRLLTNNISSKRSADAGLETVGSWAGRDTGLKRTKAPTTLVETGAESTVIKNNESSVDARVAEQIRSAAPVLTASVGAESAPQEVIVVPPSSAVSSETANGSGTEGQVGVSSPLPLLEGGNDNGVAETEKEAIVPRKLRQRRGRERPPNNRPFDETGQADDGFSEAAPPTVMLEADEAPADPRVYENGTDKSRVTLTARLDSWVQVVAEDNELLLTRILRAGDTYFVPNRPGLTLLTGNAGALEIALDGRALPPIGPVGAVRRNVSLDPAHLLRAARQTE